MTTTDAAQTDQLPKAAPPWDTGGQQDLALWYEEIFEGPRCVFIEPMNAWAVFHYDDVDRILRDDVNWSTRRRLANLPPALQEYNLVSHTVLAFDPPEHSRLRRLITPGFRHSLVKGLRERAEAISAELLDSSLPQESFDFTTATRCSSRNG